MSISLRYDSVVSMLTMKIAEHYANLFKSVERLASGKRINNADDDPAGLSLRSSLRASATALTQGSRNANDAISLLQTADGAMSIINDTLIRMKELASQASTGTYNANQRAAMNEEYQSLANEITRIATMTDFNGIKLLDGSLATPYTSDVLTPTGALRVHVGSGAHDFFDIILESVTAAALGLGYDIADSTKAGYGIGTQAEAQQALVAVAAAMERATSVQANIGSTQNRMTSMVKQLIVQTENLTAAQSRVSNANIVQEMMHFVRDKILTQMSVAIFSQANSMPSMALSLLKGGIASPEHT